MCGKLWHTIIFCFTQSQYICLAIKHNSKCNYFLCSSVNVNAIRYLLYFFLRRIRLFDLENLVSWYQGKKYLLSVANQDIDVFISRKKYILLVISTRENDVLCQEIKFLMIKKSGRRTAYHSISFCHAS